VSDLCLRSAAGVRIEVAHTVANPTQIEEEIRYLLKVAGG